MVRIMDMRSLEFERQQDPEYGMEFAVTAATEKKAKAASKAFAPQLAVADMDGFLDKMYAWQKR